MDIVMLYPLFISMENVMRMNEDVTLYENHTDMYYDLMFTPASHVVSSETVKNENCECGDCNDCGDWISGDIVQW